MDDILDRAIRFATDAHAGQLRKMADTPYILHPMEVASIIATMTKDVEVMAAGMLHDTIEDCHVPADVIREQFGPRVYALVMSETEDKLPGLSPSGSWLTRKQDSLLVLENTPFPEVKILWLADKLSNIRSFVREHERRGDAMYELLNQKDPAMHAWYYRSVAKAMPELSDTDAYREYTSLVEKLFGREAS